MLKKISLKNFKGIGAPGIEVELKPITLLFGPNSGGKSTILHSLLYAKEVFERFNYDPRTSYYKSSSVDLGGFRSLVHCHDLQKNIEIGFELDLTNESFDFDDDEDSSTHNRPRKDFLSSLTSAKLIINIGWLKNINSVVGTKYSLLVDNIPLISIGLSRYESNIINYKIESINFDHPNFVNLIEIEELSIARDFIQSNDSRINLDLVNYVHPFPTDNKTFQFVDSFLEYLMNNYEPNHAIEFFLFNLGDILNQIHSLLLSELKKFRYLGPIREIPDRNFIPHPLDEINRWASGLAAWDKIYSGYPSIDSINYWMDKLFTGYNLVKDSIVEFSNNDFLRFKYFMQRYINSIPEELQKNYDHAVDDNKSLEEFYIDLLKYLSTRTSSYDLEKMIATQPAKTTIHFTDKDKKNILFPHDIGIGLSQLIPVIVGCLDSSYSLFSIEQPELHIHPAIQVELADLFIAVANRNPEQVFLIESHSEHIILRMLRRIESEYKNNLKYDLIKDNSKILFNELTKDTKDFLFNLSPNMINIYWCDQSSSVNKFELLPIDETGEFTKPWPKGFFEERSKELFPDD